jgi:hypothetical protein
MKYHLKPYCGMQLKSVFTYPLCLALKPLIVNNFEARKRGELPDEWYWGDRLTCRLGWCVCDVVIE